MDFGLRVIRLVGSLPKSRLSDVVGRQLLRCGTSVGANYRAACRARSRADFIAKMKIVEEECDEVLYWIELLVQSNEVRASLVDGLSSEGEAILSMVVASIRTARSRACLTDGNRQPNQQSSIVNRQSSIHERVTR
jgi:four helix bundle protein